MSLKNRIYFISGKYDVENEADVGMLLQFLENDSDLDLSDDEFGEEENQFPEHETAVVRIGADKMGPRTVEIPETHWDDEDDLPLSMFIGTPDGPNFSGIITKKESVKWNRQDFQNPNLLWDEVAEESDSEIDGEDLSPLHYFERYIDELQFQKIAEFTNIYALQKNNVFKPTDSDEIKSLFGLHIAIGCLKFPQVRLFWNSSLRINLFHETMTRDRFFQLRTNLHCVNNLEQPPTCNDRLYKVRPLYEAIRKRCTELELEENLCIDEQIIPFRGNLSIKQYVKGKPTPWGVKVFVLCGKSGIAYDFIIYQGASTGLNANHLATFGLGASTILHLCERIKKEGHKLYYDNYFSSYQLLQVLKSKKIFAAGTVRVNRFSKPPLLDDKQLKAR